MTDYKFILGAVTIAIGMASYSLYLRDFYKGKTKPDPFSWFIWGFLAIITFFAQIMRGAGAGAWVTAFTAAMCICIGFISFRRGEHRPKPIDWISIAGALAGICLWFYTRDPLIAVELVIVVGIIGFVPTFKKVFSRPHEETLATFFLNAIKFAVSFAALSSFNLVTALYPVSLVLVNVLLSLTILWRRSIVARDDQWISKTSPS